FNGYGMRARDVMALLGASTAARACLWAAWILVTAPAARAPVHAGHLRAARAPGAARVVLARAPRAPLRTPRPLGPALRVRRRPARGDRRRCRRGRCQRARRRSPARAR